VIFVQYVPRPRLCTKTTCVLICWLDALSLDWWSISCNDQHKWWGIRSGNWSTTQSIGKTWYCSFKDLPIFVRFSLSFHPLEFLHCNMADKLLPFICFYNKFILTYKKVYDILLHFYQIYQLYKLSNKLCSNLFILFYSWIHELIHPITEIIFSFFWLALSLFYPTPRVIIFMRLFHSHITYIFSSIACLLSNIFLNPTIMLFL